MQIKVELSIIIVNYNSNDVLENCLQSIFRIDFPFSHEILVIDNASSASPDGIISKYHDVLLIKNERNIGFASAVNIGIIKSSGSKILLLNPDTLILDDPFSPMMKYLDTNKDVGIVGCKILREDGTKEHSTHSFPTLVKEFIHANQFIKRIIGYDNTLAQLSVKLFKFKSLESYWSHDSLREVDHVTGACLMVKREAVNNVGLLDEAFFLYNEEVEWSLRMKSAGFKSVFLPESKIIHLFGYSTGQKIQEQSVNHLLLERYRGMFYLYHKHYGFFRLTLLRVIVFQGFTFRLFSYLIKTLFSKSKEIKEQIIYTFKILQLCFHTNFDWRKS